MTPIEAASGFAAFGTTEALRTAEGTGRRELRICEIWVICGPQAGRAEGLGFRDFGPQMTQRTQIFGWEPIQ